ncbi:uncharacterized protein DFL_005378 [Arthrobotrys flagrans]|uniref:PAC domain-containing protein n=1 Tax=Arthrobotrys flagrans TaxID=97331 RepID=A0A437A7G6_ARTFL|nr:hypothetical protein DFL_005378 [Arthrobotrys flagrans]
MEARASEFMFKRLTEVAPVLRDFDVKIGCVRPDDDKVVLDGLADIMEASEPVAQTFRWITPYTTMDGQITEILALSLSQPEFAEDGSHIGYLGVSANISEQKLRERTQKKRLEEARELKRQQDNFVEIASHEMGRLLTV